MVTKGKTTVKTAAGAGAAKFGKFFNLFLLAGPWAFLAGMLHHNFQKFIPGSRLLGGPRFLDFFSVAEGYVFILVVLFVCGYVLKRVKYPKLKMSWTLKSCIILLLASGALQLIFQQVYEPVLSTPFKYFRELFIFPLLYFLIAYKAMDKRMVKRLLHSYMLMVVFFCVIALVQYFTGIFPGEKHDFMGRLVWPFVDFLSLKATSANWVAFFVMPVFLFSFIHISKLSGDFAAQVSRKIRVRSADKTRIITGCLKFYLPVMLICGFTLYMTQSYGAYVASFAAITLYFFRALSFKKFIVVFIVLFFVASGIFMLQTGTQKYRVMVGADEYRYSTSIASRSDIYVMNIHMLLEHPMLGVGLNQYQSYFAKRHPGVLGHKYNESHIPPHAHNFFTSFYTNLGILGLIAMVILMINIFWTHRLKPDFPGAFVFAAIMIHGIIDSYYWKPEIAYTFWLVVLFAYLYKIDSWKKSRS